MRLNFERHPELAQRWVVVDADSGDPIEDVAWADSTAGTYGIYRMRPRTFSDPPSADLRLRDENGKPLITAKTGAVEFVDQSADPLKAHMLALLDDPDVIAKLKRRLSLP
jgi:hypothetical protein